MGEAESTCYHFFHISEFSFKFIRFLLYISKVKYDNEIYRKIFLDMECPSRGGLSLSFLLDKYLAILSLHTHEFR